MKFLSLLPMLTVTLLLNNREANTCTLTHIHTHAYSGKSLAIANSSQYRYCSHAHETLRNAIAIENAPNAIRIRMDDFFSVNFASEADALTTHNVWLTGE